jgi:hypothetical protein
MDIRWSDCDVPDPKGWDVVTSATLRGCRIAVRLMSEALRDKGRAACIEKAEEKILACVNAGWLPEVVVVTTYDFAKR